MGKSLVLLVLIFLLVLIAIAQKESSAQVKQLLRIVDGHKLKDGILRVTITPEAVVVLGVQK